VGDTGGNNRRHPRSAHQAQGEVVVDKRKTWREQEQSLVARWNDAAERQRQLHAELSRQPGDAVDELKQKEQAVRAEIEGLRREVARLKVEFNSGKRY
jgi:peptidoglycan hydrolase CwlO-like protein